MKRGLLLLLVLVLSGCAVYATHQLDQQFGPASTQQRSVTLSDQEAQLYREEVAPILNSRCINCHACYDAPCQLKLNSKAGIERGASKVPVYDGTRLLAEPPTRLFFDGQTPDDWRRQGFHPVLNERSQSPAANLQASVLFQAIALRRQQGEFTTNILPADDYDFSLSRSQQCPSIEEYEQYAAAIPTGGMPYGLPALTDEEFGVLSRWLALGGKVPDVAPLDEVTEARVTKWEQRFNGDDLTSQLASRYIYEHIYLYSLYLDGERSQRFRLVRSRTPAGEPVQIIATRRPYDDPKVERVYYRLVLDPQTIVQKNYIPMDLTDARFQRWYSYLWSVPEPITTLPSYAEEDASNPFKTFAALPATGRYRFLLDHAQDTIMAFIKGPVCRGQVAVNVINEQFWVYFLSPDLGYERGRDFLSRQASHLDLPAAESSNAIPVASWVSYSEKQRDYLAAKAKLIERSKRLVLNENIVWDGDGNNDNAALTVFRHFDNASVVKGLVGPQPKTAWVIDYPLLERIHYLLVAGFDVYGNVGHQLVTRLYMDFLRMEGEMNFLLLLPKAEREQVRQYWYRQADQTIKDYIFSDLIKVERDSQITYQPDHPPLDQLHRLLQQRVADVANHSYDIDQMALSPVAKREWRRLQTIQGKGLRYFPNVALVLVDKADGGAQLVSLIHNKAHYNITSLLDEESSRAPDEDTLVVANGVIGDYPNVLLRIAEADLPQFVNRVGAMVSAQDYSQLLDDYGVRRTDPAFWQVSDQVARLNHLQHPNTAGVLDYNRLENR
ncbi:fatty acid cis/trans isomerase [Maribrevibacterium harenarium]|uniref:Fatty acid cis/trans isomerase n=1 Tax=Maribrevibacterium harenarium TaxID=2589817 RepID=A0A501WA31_9GAMM|nr:fatty acid cis/trans isomerase [Maribrevibacterium harenarium]TPE46793.1 fatty acid cis/trans isomerase [Maribrevibacterium harenarium]